jgi:hypothetical protein
MKKILLAGMIVMAGMGLMACGKGANADGTAEVGKLVMSTNAEFEPYEYHDGDKVVGIDPDIAEAIANKLGLELVITDTAFDSIIPEVSSGKADMGMAGMTVNEDRKKNVDFSDTYASSKQVIIVKNGSDIKGANDLKNKTIGVQLGTTGDIQGSNIEGVTMERYSKGFEAVQALSQGKIDAVLIDKQPAQYFIKDQADLSILDEAFAEEDYAIAFKKGNTELKDKVNKALEELKADGTIDKIIGKYIKAE